MTESSDRDVEGDALIISLERHRPLFPEMEKLLEDFSFWRQQ